MRPVPEDHPPRSNRVTVDTTGLGFRAKLFARRFWQPTSACMTCMPGSLLNLPSVVHWEIALRTGLFTGVLALLLSFTPLRKVFRHRYGNAVAVGCLTALGDGYSHPDHYGDGHVEALLTGAVAALLTLVGGFLFEDRGRRVRAAWRALFA